MKYLLGFLLLFIVLSVSAAIYQQKDLSNGVVYSDTPLTPDANKINIPTVASEVITTKTTPSEDAPTTKVVANKPRTPYTLFLIATPSDQQTIQNQPVIPVEIQVNPELQQNDTIQLYLDNKPWGKAEKLTHFELNNVERGTHQLYAKILDEKGNSLKESNQVTLYIHRASVTTINANKNRPAN